MFCRNNEKKIISLYFVLYLENFPHDIKKTEGLYNNIQVAHTFVS